MLLTSLFSYTGDAGMPVTSFCSYTGDAGMLVAKLVHAGLCWSSWSSLSAKPWPSLSYFPACSIAV
jgi:hypothetical protein